MRQTLHESERVARSVLRHRGCLPITRRQAGTGRRLANTRLVVRMAELVALQGHYKPGRWRLSDSGTHVAAGDTAEAGLPIVTADGTVTSSWITSLPRFIVLRRALFASQLCAGLSGYSGPGADASGDSDLAAAPNHREPCLRDAPGVRIADHPHQQTCLQLYFSIVHPSTRSRVSPCVPCRTV